MLVFQEYCEAKLSMDDEGKWNNCDDKIAIFLPFSLIQFFSSRKGKKLILYKALKRDYSILKNASGKHSLR